MKKVSVTVGVVAALFASFAANAAVLEGVQGGVKVNHGVGYSSATSSTEVAAGDRVMVGRNGAARVVYSDGCRVSLPAGSVTTIPATSPCTWRAQQAGGDFGGVNIYAVGAGLIVAGGIAAAVASSSSGGCTSRLFPVSGGAIGVCN